MTESFGDRSRAGLFGPGPAQDPACATALAETPGIQVLARRLEAAGLSMPSPEVIPYIREASQEFAATDEELSLGGAFAISEHVVPGPPGAPPIVLVVCAPSRVTGPTPLIYNIHGGGMVAGTARTFLTQTLEVAAESGAMVVSVEYRLAPDHRHPAPVEDAYAGLRWIVEHADDLGVDATRIVTYGVSAGGGIAAALALLARDRNGPRVAGQLLFCPMLDDRNNTPSVTQMAGRDLWDRDSNDMGWTALLGSARGGPDVSPYAAPARATDLSGLPPAYLHVGSAETLRDEVVDYAARIWLAGGPAELHVWPGGFHSFEHVGKDTPLGADAWVPVGRWLARLWGAGVDEPQAGA